MKSRINEALITVALAISFMVGCHHSPAGVPATTQPSPGTPEIQIDPSNVAGFIDNDLDIFSRDMLNRAKAGPTQSFPPRPPNPFDGGPVTFAAYNKWLSEVVDAVQQGSDPSKSTQYSSDATAAYQELYNYSGIQYECLNVPSCKDTDLMRAEPQGLDLASVGVRIAKTFANQSQATQAAAAAYLQKTYALASPPPS